MPTAGLTQILNEVALTALPWAVLHRILSRLGGPKAESIVVLSSEDDPLHARTLEGRDPLLDIEHRRSEGLGRGIAIAPL